MRKEQTHRVVENGNPKKMEPSEKMRCITPTYPQSKLTSNLNDYGKKGSIMFAVSRSCKRSADLPC